MLKSATIQALHFFWSFFSLKPIDTINGIISVWNCPINDAIIGWSGPPNGVTPALYTLVKFLWILLDETDDAIAKLYVT